MCRKIYVPIWEKCMDNNQNLSGYIRMMKDILVRKRNALKNILDYSIQQNEFFNTPEFDDEGFSEFMDKKDVEIKKINDLDDGFTAVYNKIKEDIHDKGEEHAEAIKELQELITEVTELGVRITAQEKLNRDALEKRKNELKKGVRNFNVSRQTATSYYKNMNGLNSSGPVFMDQKN